MKFKDEALDRAADLAHRLDVDGALSGVSVIARRPDGAGIGCGSVGVGLMDTATEVDVSRDLHPDDLDNEGLAEEVAAFLCGAIDAIHQVAWGAAWFGGGEHEPYVTRLVGRFDERLLHGYSWVVVLTPFVCERLGGRNVVRHSLSELGVLEWTCGDYVVAALAAAPSSVTADSLRRWKEFLSPALAPLSDRLHRVLARRRGTEPIDTLPPFLFAADWYYRDPVPTGEAS